jgi:UDP-N-acetylglucosamine 2-epimerase
MKLLKIVIVVGTRPEIIRLSRVINRLDEFCDLTLIHTGQNYDYELNQIFFEDLGVKKPDYFLDSAQDSNSPSQTIANIISGTDTLLDKIKPDSLLVLGDTNSCLSVIPAKRRKISIFHMEAGNRCFDERVPEETNRRMVDHIADINLPYSTIARDYLIKEGFPIDRIIKTGSPMREVIETNKEQIDNSEILKKLVISPNNYFVVSCHREENLDNPKLFNQFIEILNKLVKNYSFPVIVSTHPRTRAKINESKADLDSLIQLLDPLGFNDYLKLQINSTAVLSDSGTISEESSILNFPAINIREAHERPEAMEETPLIMTGMNIDRIFQSLPIVMNKVNKESITPVKDYESSNVSFKVLRIIHSYQDYVQREVWKRYN